MSIAQIVISPQVVVLGTQEAGFTVHFVNSGIALAINAGIQGPMPSVSGSGFAHVTAGAWDAAARNPTGSEVTQDSTHRFVTDAEKATWSAKQDPFTVLDGRRPIS